MKLSDCKEALDDLISDLALQYAKTDAEVIDIMIDDHAYYGTGEIVVKFKADICDTIIIKRPVNEYVHKKHDKK